MGFLVRLGPGNQRSWHSRSFGMYKILVCQAERDNQLVHPLACISLFFSYCCWDLMPCAQNNRGPAEIQRPDSGCLKAPWPLLEQQQMPPVSLMCCCTTWTLTLARPTGIPRSSLCCSCDISRVINGPAPRHLPVQHLCYGTLSMFFPPPVTLVAEREHPAQTLRTQHQTWATSL